MRKILTGILVGVLILSFAAPSFAEVKVPEKVKSSVNKLSRGVANVLSAPLEIGKQITLEWRATDHKHLALVGGLLKGLGYTFKRAGSGLLDIVTFPVRLNEDLDPVMKPEFVFD